MNHIERREGVARFFILTTVLGLAWGMTALAQQGYSGRALYETYCLSCHGDQGKGDGSFAKLLRKSPADLTQITPLADGSFPAVQVFRTIDGRDPVAGHGGGDMPVWGDAFAKSRDGSSPEAVKAKVDALVRYVRTLQPKS